MLEPLEEKEGEFEVTLGETFHSPTSSLHTFRYNFAPDSVDKTRGKYEGTLDGVATVTFANAHKGEGHVFKGTSHEGKDNDCLLIYDQETGQFTLEKLASNINLRNVRPAGKTKSPGKMTSEQPPKLTTDTTEDGDNFSDLEESLLRDLEGSR